jgi:hypothetical protein
VLTCNRRSAAGQLAYHQPQGLYQPLLFRRPLAVEDALEHADPLMPVLEEVVIQFRIDQGASSGRGTCRGGAW